MIFYCNLLFLKNFWQRGRDSNPRYAMNVYTLSRRATSTTHPPLRLITDTVLERVKGIEPSSKAWEAFVLPLNYTRCGKPRHYKRRLLFLIPFTAVYFP